MRNELTDRLGLEYPIIQAPMAGGVTTSELVAAVSNKGALGMIGAGYMSPSGLRDQIRDIKKRTSNLFGINLFVPSPFSSTQEDIQHAQELLKPFRTQLKLEEQEINIPDCEQEAETFAQLIDIVLEEKIGVCSFTFGLPSGEVIKRLKAHGVVLIGTAATVREAIEAERSGMDMVVVQGCEAGGHRGAFLPDAKESMIGLMSLIPQAVDSIEIPVIAAGGIMDGRALMAARCLGAKGVMMGTAFLTCSESGASSVHKKAVLEAREDEIVMTRAFSGKWARGVHNRFIEEMKHSQLDVPVFPVQNTLTKAIRSASSSQGNPDCMSLWSGQSPMLAKEQTAAQLIDSVTEQAQRILNW
ncbi:nitronate monooxygenase [Jeotgalibacillus sp. S-D1]|uniref:NAD(P)H-dependent flavin oxidoreductase n=1 Tax=Jeotgalibacillus sp. S-D1 TaxID=2552189 RepID=UPI00105A3512|nr:nitronate monooxygenase [Jeotgalibacillus sp. S-D1]TDL30869.1 nitronate monooxygenase [Jeotgalibacillus sp. S-D1]